MAKQSTPFVDATDSSKDAMRSNSVVRTQIARIITPRNKKGKNKRYTPRQAQNRINEYFQWCEVNDRVPSIKGLMLHLKLCRDTFYNYIEDPALGNIFEQARLVIIEWVENDIYRTPGQAAGKIAYAKNVHNWADKIDTTSINENRNTTVLTVEDAKARIASLVHLINPELLTAVTNKYTLNQLSHQEVTDVTP